MGSGIRLSPASASAQALLQQYLDVRAQTGRLCAPLTAEDCQAQSMPDCSPAKWHLAHTTWFFETFVLKPHVRGWETPEPAYAYLFNSYYNAAGKQAARDQRGLMTRPTLAQTLEYRRLVDDRMQELLTGSDDEQLQTLVTLGINHEQQHQELLLTDIKHLLSLNPLRPVYSATAARASGGQPASLDWIELPTGIVRIGYEGSGFHYDNEGPAHRVFLEPAELASRLSTSAEYLAFIADGGYRRPELWLSAGWSILQQQGWRAPLYWELVDGEWHSFTLGGMRPVDPLEPVTHLSLYEADAFARWSEARLPTEFEWEAAAVDAPIAGNFVESGRLHPVAEEFVGADHRSDRPGFVAEDPASSRYAGSPDASAGSLQRAEASSAPTNKSSGDESSPLSIKTGRPVVEPYGNCWQWCNSQYLAYPGYQPAAGALGEYNGKFMSNQFVLRGGSCATPQSHIRATYRNFFPAEARWQFSGVRLARDLR
jgi:ergothioneine biosynthesis protein EgtB